MSLQNLVITKGDELEQLPTKPLEMGNDSLRPAEVVFARCCLTGQWGKCVAIDLGDISIDAPNTEKGVVYDPETKTVEFTVMKPAVFQMQATFSKEGLQMLSNYLDSQENPIPGITPDLVYQWRVAYKDGRVQSQYVYDSEADEEKEVDYKEINWPEVQQLSVVPHYGNEEDLPTFTFVKPSGKIFRKGQELDLMYDGEYHPEADTIYYRKVTMTFGSAMKPNSLNRGNPLVNVSVLQIMGWAVGGIHGEGPRCLIAIDERGNFRPYEYVE